MFEKPKEKKEKVPSFHSEKSPTPGMNRFALALWVLKNSHKDKVPEVAPNSPVTGEQINALKTLISKNPPVEVGNVLRNNFDLPSHIDKNHD